MANVEHVAILERGVAEWNAWRKRFPEVIPDLSTLTDRDQAASWRGRDLSFVDLRRAHLLGTDFAEAKLVGAQFVGAIAQSVDFSGADLTQTNLWNADLFAARFRGAKLIRTNLHSAHLRQSQFSEAHLARTTLIEANLTEALFDGATISEADMRRAILVRTDFRRARLHGCRVYGVSAWDLKLEGASQTDLRIGELRADRIAVDDLEVAQFIHLLLHSPKIRTVIDTVGRRGVLLLGRFTDDRKPVLEAMRGELRRLGYLPIVFDFERPTERDLAETVMVLAGMSLFIVADITSPRSSPLELQATVPDYMIPFVPILQAGEQPFSMFTTLQNKYHWVLDVLEYDSIEQLIATFDTHVVGPALAKHQELIANKAAPLRIRRLGDAGAQTV
jgi:hypothetical protein